MTDRPNIRPMMTLRPAAAANTYELLIYGDIGDNWWGESVTAKSVVEQLNALDAAVSTINVRINSYGGAVADGLAIYNALKRHPATKAVTVDGVAMSIASLIAMSGDTVSMPATSLLMIHAPWGGVAGNASELREYADVLDTYAASMADAYVAKSGKSRDDILALLSDGADHYYTGAEAVDEGFADRIDTPESDPAEPDAAAREFARALFDRVCSRGGSMRMASLAAVAAARRGPGAASHTHAGEPSAAAPATTDATASNPNPPSAPDVQPPPAFAGNSTEVTDMDPKQILAADKKRRETIRNQFAPFAARADLDAGAIAALQTACEDDHECTPEAAGSKLLALLGKTPATPTGIGGESIVSGRDEADKYRANVSAALLHRADPASNKLDDGSRQFASLDLSDLARDAVERAGHRTRGMSKREIAVKALQSTSDFPAILENIVTKTLRAGYDAAPRTFVPFCRQASLPDFKQISRAQLGGAPNLLRVLEGAEYEFGSIGDGAEKYAVQKYGRQVAITWEAIVNDDLDALTRIPQAFGASAAALESDIVYGILTGNPNMADGIALFASGHGNLGTATALSAALNSAAGLDPLAEARENMVLQKGIEGRYIAVRPQYLIVPPKLEKIGLQITGTNYQPALSKEINVFGPSLTLISEPRLQDSSVTAYFLAASPTTVDTIEYAYLQGEEGVFTETKNGFEVDGLVVKCRHVFGAKAIDFRGLYKNAGA